MTLRLSRPPETDDELYYTVKALWGTTIPRHRSDAPECADHVAPFTAFADAYFNRDSITDPHNPKESSVGFWHGSRGLSGKSYTLSNLGLAKPFLQGAEANILGGSFTQSANIHEHIRTAMESKHAPRDMIVKEGNELIKLTNKARVRPLTASQKTVRGPHPPLLILDEIDEMELAILEAALGQPMEQINYRDEVLIPYTVMCSTWQNPDGTFTKMLQRAEESAWPIYRWCYRESSNPIDGWLSPEHIERQKKLISGEMWRVEYELGEPSIGNRAFDTPSVEATFNLPFKPDDMIVFKETKDFVEYRFEDWDKRSRYVAAADWGKEQDYTVIGVYKIPKRGPATLVYFARMNRRPYPQMIGFFNRAIRDYRVDPQYAVHDRTGVGVAVADLVDTRAYGFKFTPGSKAELVTEYVATVETKAGTGEARYSLPRIPTMFSEHKYCRTGDLYSSAQEFHLPDSVAMAAMANRIIRGLIRFTGGKGGEAVEKVKGEPSRIEKVLGGEDLPEDDALRPDNDGEGRVIRRAPEAQEDSEYSFTV